MKYDRTNSSSALVDGASQTRRLWLRPLGWSTVVGFTFFAAVFAWLVLDKIKAQSRRDVGEVLTAVLNTSEEAMRHLVVKYKEDADTWASSADLLENVKALLGEPRDRKNLLASPAQARLRRLLQPIVDKRGYVGIFVIAPDNTSLASMRASNVGSTNLLILFFPNLVCTF